MSTGEPVPRTESVHFGRYEVARRPDGTLDKLGAGAMGVTYRARDTLLQRLVVLKVVNADLLSGDGGAARKRFLREAAAAAQLVHPHVAAVHDIGVEADKDFYVMEFVQGRSLDDEVRAQGHLEPAIVLTIARHVALALAAAWQHQLIHRDIKPANLMLTHPPENSPQEHDIWVKVIDFGLAKSVRRGGNQEATASMVSVTGAFLGTPAFASPEQLEGRDLDTRTDLYSLGITLFYALCGELPFTGTTLGQLITGHLAKPPPLGRLRELHVPEPLVALIGRLLAKEPDQRPADGEVLLGLIEEVKEQITPPSPGSSVPELSRHDSPTIGDPVEAPPAPVPTPAPVVLPAHPPVSPSRAEPLPRVTPRVPPAPAQILPQPPPPRQSPRLPPARIENVRLPPPPAPAKPSQAASTVGPRGPQPPPSTPPARSFPLVPILGVAGLGLILVLLAVLEPGGRKPSREDPTPTPAPARATPTPTRGAPTAAPRPTALALPTPVPTAGPRGDAFGSALRQADGITISNAVLEAERLAPSDIDAAMAALERAANGGDIAAQSMLAAAYANGLLFRPDRAGVRLSSGKNAAQAVRWARVAAERGDARAIVTLASAFLTGEGVPEDSRQGLELARASADRGEPIAQLFVALIYSNGASLTISRDPARARAYIERSVASGFTAARALYGAWLTIGLNVPADPPRGIRLLEEAEREGSVIATFQLGVASYNGSGVPRNKERAATYYRIAARAGYEPAMLELRRMGETW